MPDVPSGFEFSELSPRFKVPAQKGKPQPATPELRREAEASKARARHAKAAVDVFESLPPSQQDVLLCLKEYGTLVSWSQVTPAAPDSDGQQGKPWNSLDGVLSPEAALATSVSLSAPRLLTELSHLLARQHHSHAVPGARKIYPRRGPVTSCQPVLPVLSAVKQNWPALSWPCITSSCEPLVGTSRHTG